MLARCCGCLAERSLYQVLGILELLTGAEASQSPEPQGSLELSLAQFGICTPNKSLLDWPDKFFMSRRVDCSKDGPATTDWNCTICLPAGSSLFSPRQRGNADLGHLPSGLHRWSTRPGKASPISGLRFGVGVHLFQHTTDVDTVQLWKSHLHDNRRDAVHFSEFDNRFLGHRIHYASGSAASTPKHAEQSDMVQDCKSVIGRRASETWFETAFLHWSC
ncbi:unnamed protein product [Protopolystoma xenopodis]|uniref:Uncharacterized protein n=1 Tax=Protopolystoma xenopodis TaxID=117903 RepID=A0A448XCX0_9PLAT|nr:unnamed protein product [Protopolystoma xenopodis]